MNKRKQNTEFYIRPSAEIYGKDGVERILNTFKELNPDSEKGQMGAGASGLMPELAMTLIAGASLIGLGFLNAIGEDIYKLLKSSITKLIKIKPNRDAPSLPPNYKGDLYTHLICWFYFEDTKILLEINLDNEKGVEKALNMLPDFIDNISAKHNNGFIRLLWDDNKWLVLE